MDILAWVSSSAVIALIAWFTGNRWERRKLSRAERAIAYSNLLSACSRWWGAFADRDRVPDREAPEWRTANDRVRATRHEAWDAYATIQILGSQAVVQAALELIRAYDRRNKAYHARTTGVADDVRAALLAEFVTASRKDLHLKALDRTALKSSSA